MHLVFCKAASNPYHASVMGISDGQSRKISVNNVLAKHWLISMLARDNGAIILVSSIGGMYGSDNRCL